jgi:hypothetical protein
MRRRGQGDECQQQRIPIKSRACSPGTRKDHSRHGLFTPLPLLWQIGAVKAINPQIAFYMNGGKHGGDWATARLNRVLVPEQGPRSPRCISWQATQRG